MITRKKNIKEIKNLLATKQNEMKFCSSLKQFLISRGISSFLATSILKELIENDERYELLEEIIAKKIRTTGELSFDKKRTVAFVGPTGVGKTTLILKLANFYQQNCKKVAIVTAEIGGAENLRFEGLLKQARIPLLDGIDKEGDYDLQLVDTKGCSFYLPNRVEDLGERLEKYENIQIFLTLSAAAKDVDLYGAIHQFSSLQPHALAFTKLDETLAPGSLLNVSIKSDLPISYIAYGYPLPGEVKIADPLFITHKILTDFNREDFHFIRQIKLLEEKL